MERAGDLNVKEIMAQLTGGHFALLGLALAGAAFGAALFAQYALGMAPCPLCIWQRYPYVAGGVFALVAALARAPRLQMLALGLAALSFVVGAGVGVFHSGVEFGWWDGLATCGGVPLETLPVFGEEVDIPADCTARDPFLLGLSMANLNVLASLEIAGVFAAGAAVARRAAA
ncbi:MAG: disulfide bond formation protein B [Pseudomonadota bacterium]